MSAQDCNLIYNGDLQKGKAGWVRYDQEGGKSNWEVDSLNRLHFNIIKKGRKFYSIQLIAPMVYLEMGETYQVAFDVQATGPALVKSALSMNHGPWKNFTNSDITVDTGVTSHTFTYTMEDSTDAEARLEINLGGESGIYECWISNVSVVNTACAGGLKPRVTENELILKEEEMKNRKVTRPQVEYKKGYMPLQVSGYVRMNAVYRNLNEAYDNEPYAPKDLVLNGVYPDSPPENGLETGYREPLVMLQLTGKPSPNTNFNVDFLIDNQMIGTLSDSSRRFETYRFLNMGGTAQTKLGTFHMELGGVNFVRMSPFTLWRYEYRDDMFERYPWEWNRRSFPRYEEFFGSAAVGRDSRFGSAAIQGVVLKAKGLPQRFSALTVYGKSNISNNGWLSFLNNNYKYIFAQQIGKQLGRHFVNLNYYQQRGYIDNIKPTDDVSNLEDERVMSMSGGLNFKNVRLTTELGAGSFVNPDVVTRNWAPAFFTKAYIKRLIPGVPVAIQAYHIGRDFLNPNSTLMNTLPYDGGQFGQEFQYLNTIYKGGVAELGQLSNNREGVNFFFSKYTKNLRLEAGYGISQEVVVDADTISFQHRLAALNRSRFLFYRAEAGPYNRIINTWRRSYEVMTLGDSTQSGFKKGFNTVDLSLKYKGYLGDKPFIFSAYANYNSVQQELSATPLFNDEAFLRLLYQEYEIFVGTSDRVTWVAQVAFETAKGNQLTDLSENGLPIDQKGTAYGIGVDLDFKNSGLFIRQKWYEHEDANFELDRFSGWETTVELKVFF